MKLPVRSLPIYLLSLLSLLSGGLLRAQTIDALADFPQTVDAVVCQGTGSFTLTASTNAGGGMVYDASGYSWADVTGGGNSPFTETSNQLTISTLAPGYHTYRVLGKVTSTATCTADFEDFTIYVLPSLNISITSTGTANANTFCSDNLPASLGLSASLSHSATENFGYNYQWYKVVGGAESPIGGATAATYSVPASDLVLGQATYKIKATFKVLNSCTYDSSTSSGGTVDITIKPKPTKPTITLTMN